MRSSSLAAACAALVLACPPIRAQEAASDRVRIDYAAPKEARHAPVLDGLRQRRALETVQTMLSPLRLPRPLTIKTESCDGEVNAWFEGDSVTICYEYVEMIADVARKPGRPGWVQEETARMGAFIEVALHEAGHALFHLLKIPILGREEDAADQFAALILLSGEPDKAAQMIAGVAAVHLDEAGFKSIRQLNRLRLGFSRANRYAGVHSTPVQRLYNLLCLAYGSDPARYNAVRVMSAVPDERLDGCAEEYDQLTHAFTQLILPHVDSERARQVYGPAWPLPRPRP